MSIDPSSTRMFAEAAEAADVAERQLRQNAETVARIGERLRARPPRFITTVARGSSDHAASYARYLLETRTGLVTASCGPSVVSVYGAQLQLQDSLCLLISQSGASEDLLAMAREAKRAGAYVVALVNVENSPLAASVDEVIALRAGVEASVAATKSFIASLTAIAHLLAQWKQDDALGQALEQTPALLREAWADDWSAALPTFAGARGLFVLGRGLGLGIACEAALKFKEVCGLHAEAFSSAEVLHGPVSIVRDGFPVLVLAQDDACLPGIRSLVDELVQRRVPVVTAGVNHPGALNLPAVAGHPAIEPILRIQGFYRLANVLSVQLGRDPDRPPHLAKVTSTL